MSSELIAVKARRVITPLQDLREGVVLVEGDKIAAVGLTSNIAVPESARVIDVGAKILAPGFLDLHHHGAMGAYAADGPDAVIKIAQYLVKTGTTGWLPTVNSMEGVRAIVEAKRRGTGTADVVGVHMEGPFLAPKRVPGQEVLDRGLHEPSIELFGEFFEAADGNLKLMGVAPELPGALDLIREMRRAGVVPAIAHTKATYEQFMRAVEAGARHVTHTYNVMTGFHHRKPGIVGAVLTCDQVTSELIADRFHVSPPAMDILIRCKGVDKVAVITDNVPLAGLPDGTYEMFGRTIVKKDGVSRVAGSTPDQDNTMAGSEWPLNSNIHNLVDLVGVRLGDAVRMATLTPAMIVDVDAHKGSIEPGKDADLVVIDEQVRVYLTMVRGQVVFQSGLDAAL
ncbi:MAG TPA: N-acetylglucosamine-6-phosphate deacetylase [Anaerolineae bacterium]|nr:N-acetylglucosamine-6-phosphate deacetylase [Anaerolineae bacterium]